MATTSCEVICLNMAFLPISRVFNLKTLSETKLSYRSLGVGLVFSLAKCESARKLPQRSFRRQAQRAWSRLRRHWVNGNRARPTQVHPLERLKDSEAARKKKARLVRD